MHRFLLAAFAGITLLVTPAVAADLPARMPVKAPPVAPAIGYDWTGYYAGLNAGVGWSHDTGGDISGDTLPFGFQDCITASVCPGRINVRYDGFIGGAQFGFNWQQDRFVLGAEADIDYTDFTGSTTVPITQATGATLFTLSQRVDWLATVRGRLGVTPMDRVLAYVTGGLAFGHVKSEFTVPSTNQPTFDGTDSKVLTGWTFGLGAEYALQNNWSAKVEALYYDLGSSTVTASNPSPYFGTADAEYKGYILRAGFNYRFGPGRSVAY